MMKGLSKYCTKSQNLIFVIYFQKKNADWSLIRYVNSSWDLHRHPRLPGRHQEAISSLPCSCTSPSWWRCCSGRQIVLRIFLVTILCNNINFPDSWPSNGAMGRLLCGGGGVRRARWWMTRCWPSSTSSSAPPSSASGPSPPRRSPACCPRWWTGSSCWRGSPGASGQCWPGRWSFQFLSQDLDCFRRRNNEAWRWVCIMFRILPKRWIMEVYCLFLKI